MRQAMRSSSAVIERTPMPKVFLSIIHLCGVCESVGSMERDERDGLTGLDAATATGGHAAARAEDLGEVDLGHGGQGVVGVVVAHGGELALTRVDHEDDAVADAV